MVDMKFAAKVLGAFYEKWFENYVIGVSHRELDTIVEGERNEILKMIETLENKNMIWKKDRWYSITAHGIETYEEALPPSTSNKRITQRNIILKILKEIYDKDVNGSIDDKILTKKLDVDNNNELRGQLAYLEEAGLIKYDPFMGGNFLLQLTSEGSAKFESYEEDESIPMTRAYEILFKLENRLRIFIEKKLTEQFNDEWWKQGISTALRNKADERKEEESIHGWTISEPKTDLDYLSFPHLGKIITNNWKDVFEKHFKDQATIELKLNELEEIRNSIAHMRTLSSDGYTRLEQYNSDILNLTN